MGNARRKRLPAEVGELRGRVEEWRRRREKRGPMPDELWSQAVLLAKEHGTCRIARAVGIDYVSLRGRLERSRAAATRPDESSGGFVELPTTVSACPAPGGAGRLAGCEPVQTVEGGAGSTAQFVEAGVEPTATVELTARDGARLTVRLQSCGGVDLLGLANAFWGRSS
jgi:hypothetical protein